MEGVDSRKGPYYSVYDDVALWIFSGSCGEECLSGIIRCCLVLSNCDVWRFEADEWTH